MSIIRTEHNKNNPYVILNKTALEDKNLSWAAKGLWSYLMSRPDDWQVSVAHLSSIYSEYGGGETAIYNYLNELIKNGYCEAKQSKGEKGQFGKYEYIITEFKKIIPQPGSPDAGPPDAANIPTTNKGVIQKKETTTQQVGSCGFSDAEKVKVMQNLRLSENVIERALRFTLDEIKLAIECCLNESKTIDNIDGYFLSALKEKWQPKPNKLDKAKVESAKEREQQLQQQREIEQQERLSKKIYLEAKQLEIAYKNKMTDDFHFIVTEKGISTKISVKGYDHKIMDNRPLTQNSLVNLNLYINENKKNN